MSSPHLATDECEVEKDKEKETNSVSLGGDGPSLRWKYVNKYL